MTQDTPPADLLTDAEWHRIDHLLASMSREQKLDQLRITATRDHEAMLELARRGIGALFWPGDAAAANAAQRIAVQESPHGIPLLMGLDVIHGCRTIFPVPLAQACSFDPRAAETDGRVSGAEARSGGVTWCFSPMVDVSRDARWGRVCEGFGEDPVVASRFGAAKIRGFQGSERPFRLAACLKHYVAYGAAEAGRDYNSVDISQRRLRDVYLPPFRAGVDAGALSVMASFNTVAGRPVHANHQLLTGILKQEWGFPGLVVGDADGVRNLVAHGVATNHAEAQLMAYTAGLDVEMGLQVADAGTTPEELPSERIDDAVRRVLAVKTLLGLFDNPFVDEDAEVLQPDDEARRAALDIARRCPVLLKNDAGTLPIPASTRRVAVVGPYATSTDHLGAWVVTPGTPASSLAAELSSLLPDAEVCAHEVVGFLDDEPLARVALDEALRDADVVVVAVGEPSQLSGEASSRSDLRLPGRQEELVRAVVASGKPCAVVVVAGRPLVLSDWIDGAPSVLFTHHLGTMGAHALAEILVGLTPPTGRLAMALPRSVGQLPYTYAHENTGRPPTRGGSMEPLVFDPTAQEGPANITEHFTSKYRDLPLGPLFEFGHGLGYRTPTLGAATLSRDDITARALRAGERVEVTIEVSNPAGAPTEDVVFLFLHDEVASLAQPVRRLADFRRLELPAGGSRSVTLGLGWSELAFWSEQHNGFVVEPGDVTLYVGRDLASATPLRLHVGG